MSSGIDSTKPTAGTALTADVRNNFASAEGDIDELHRLTRDQVIATGTADALVATNTNPIASYINGDFWAVEAAFANTSTTPTINVDAKGAKTITKTGTLALEAGDIKLGMICLFKYDSGSDIVQLLNPGVELSNVDHDTLLNFVANKHIDHTAVTLTAGVGIAGGGDISASRTFDLDVNSLTEDTTPDAAADFVVTYDTSAALHKKVKPVNLSGASSLTTDGYAFIGPILLQWGEKSVAFDNTAVVTWPLAFPTAVLQATISQGENFTATDDAGAAIYSLTTTTATVKNGAGSADGNQILRWFAVGH